MESCGTWPFVSGLSHSCCGMSERPFLWLSDCHCIDRPCCSSVDRYVGCIHLSAVSRNAAVHMHVQEPVRVSTRAPPECVPGSGAGEADGGPVLSSPRSRHHLAVPSAGIEGPAYPPLPALFSIFLNNPLIMVVKWCLVVVWAAFP